jgi:hypothetical protein
MYDDYSPREPTPPKGNTPFTWKQRFIILLVLVVLFAAFAGCTKLMGHKEPIRHDPVGDCPSGSPLTGC